MNLLEKTILSAIASFSNILFKGKNIILLFLKCTWETLMTFFWTFYFYFLSWSKTIAYIAVDPQAVLNLYYNTLLYYINHDDFS